MTTEKFFSTLAEVENKTRWEEVAPFQISMSPISNNCGSINAIEKRQYEITCDGVAYEIPQGFENSIFYRAQIYGQALQIMPPEYVADVVNSALSFRPRNERYKMLIRGGKCFAVHSSKYSPLSQERIYTISAQYLEDIFDGKLCFGEYTDALTVATFETESPKLLQIYKDAFQKVGRELTFKKFEVEIVTSDVTVSGANVYLYGISENGARLPFGEISTKHIGGNNLKMFTEKLDEIFPLLQKKADDMAELADLELAYPCNVLLQLFKKLKFGKKISTKIHNTYSTFQGENADTAMNVYLEICSYVYELKGNGASPMQIIDAESKISSITAKDFKNMDLPGVFAWEA